MEIKTVKIDSLKFHPKNPRKHSAKAIEKIEQSIKEFGWTNPVLVSEDGYILAGHARVKAGKKAGLEEVPVIFLPLKGKKADAYLIADNRLQDETEWDLELLDEMLADLKNEFTGFELEEIEMLENLDIEEILEDYEAPEEKEIFFKCPHCGYIGDKKEFKE